MAKEDPLAKALEERIEVVEQEHRALCEALRAISTEDIEPLHVPQRRLKRPGSVSPARINTVFECIRDADGPIRQADIAKITNINSGSISNAVRHLEEQGKIVRGVQDGKSPNWMLAR